MRSPIMGNMLDPQMQAEVLNQALPYIQEFRGQTFVVKYGGSAMKDPALMAGVIRNVLLLQLVGIKPVLAHGGGPEIDSWLAKLGIEKKTLRGLRVTDDETMDVVEMALGKANKAIVGEIQRAGGRAVGLSGRDGDLMLGEPISDDLGRVGRITQVNPHVIQTVTDRGYVPVVSCIAAGLDRRPMNVNGDTAAAALAGALGASKLILLTDTNGVLLDKEVPDSTISILSPEEASSMLASGAADRGMIPKLEAALHALREGVESVHMINGGTPNALLVEVFTDAGVGTMMRD